MSYPGSKGQAGVWQRIIGQMPPHTVYVEPFAGSAQIFFRKRPAARSILIDANAGVVAKLRDAISGPVEIHYRDAVHWLQRQEGNAGCLIYCDPPYLLSTRTKKRLYGEHEMSDEQHASLLSALLQLRCYVMISGYPSELYSSRLRDWRCVSYRTRTRGATVTECLWCNFPQPTELHDWRYAGRDSRQRFKWREIEQRFLAKLNRMSPLKRGYVLDLIERRLNERRRIPTPLLAPVTKSGDAYGGTDRLSPEVVSPAVLRVRTTDVWETCL